MSTRARAVAPLHEGGEHVDELSRLGAHDGRTEYPLARGVEEDLENAGLVVDTRARGH
jgi:hypothetical protein